jgi:hypothetical protein
MHTDNNICYDSGQAEVTAACPTGWVITGGGLAVSSAAVMYDHESTNRNSAKWMVCRR